MSDPVSAAQAGNRTFLRVAVEEWGTWVRVRAGQDGRLAITGPMANILHVFAEKMNFDYELVQPPDHVWGVPLPDGNWTGMLGMLQRQCRTVKVLCYIMLVVYYEVEFALGPFGVTSSRETVCDFSVPVKTENSAILVVRPAQQSDVSGFLKPFTISVWLLILASVVAVFVAFACVMVAEGKLFCRSPKNPLSLSALWVVKALTQEVTSLSLSVSRPPRCPGTEWLPKTDGARVVVATWLLASLVFMSSYSGILTAMLTVPRVDIPIDSMRDLVTQTDIPWRLESGSWMLQYFQEAPDGVRQRIYEGHTGTFPDCWAARGPISRGEYAALCDHTTMKKAMSWDFSTSGSCHLYISREVIHSFNLAVAFRTASPYKEEGDYWIQKLKESGILDMWLQNEIVNTSQCLKPPSADRSSQDISALDLESFFGPMLVLAAGLCLALAAIIVEGAVRFFEGQSSASVGQDEEHTTGVGGAYS
ncbi:glutamate receptor ionotropic, delta-1-like [Penaeus indicus]|uniref:glutamate receptor ionotropic, delta-1-like n=1 Tax=Penaeus indicus TaxID=29960 RepID=UPI00300C7D3E